VKTLHVLIIDDHPLICEAYKNALSFINNNELEFQFKIHESNDCTNAYEKVLKLGSSLNLIFLDINLPKCTKNNFFSGEDLGKKIRQVLPNIKIIVATSHFENLRLYSILKNVNPEGFLIKSDFNSKEFMDAVKFVLKGKSYYSNLVLEFLRKKQSKLFNLDTVDIKILQEISNGSTVKELMKEILLSKSGIEKRKRKLKTIFNVACESDRSLVLAAKEKGFI